MVSAGSLAAAGPPQTHRHGIVAWGLAQIGLFLRLLAHVVLGGLIVSMARREFHWRACGTALLVMALGMGGVGFVAYTSPDALGEPSEIILWGSIFGMMCVAGFGAGYVGRRVAYWEMYLATLLLALVVIVHLTKGWHILLGMGSNDGQIYHDVVGTVSLGQRYLGPMWDRLVALAAVVGFLCAVLGGSVAFLFFGDGERFDGAFAMEWMVAYRHLCGRSSGLLSVTALVAMAGIALGVASLVAVTAVMSGYQQDIQAKILSTNAHLVVQKYGIDFAEYEDVIARGREVPGIVAATPFTFNEAMMASHLQGVGVLLKGVIPERAGTVTGIARNLCHDDAFGRCVYFSAGDPNARLTAALAPQEGVPSVVVGDALLRRLRLRVGEEVMLTTPVGLAGAHGNAPRRMAFRIGGVFRSGMYEFDARLAYMALDTSQRFMGLGDAVSGVEFRVADPDRVEALASQLLSVLGRYPYKTLDWRELNMGIFTALKLQKIVMFLVLTFIVIVASFNIASTLFMAVVEKAHEIAVLKSMGARDGSVMKIFVLQGWLTGLAGTAAGLFLGLAVAFVLGGMDIHIAADVYMVEALRVRVRPMEVCLTAMAALAISHLATLYPALKAARQDPVDAMRYA